MPFALLHSLTFPTAEGWVGTHPSMEQDAAHPKITLTSFCRAREGPGPRPSSCPTTRQMQVSLLFPNPSTAFGRAAALPGTARPIGAMGPPRAHPTPAPRQPWGPRETRARGPSRPAHTPHRLSPHAKQPQQPPPLQTRYHVAETPRNLRRQGMLSIQQLEKTCICY